MTAITVTQQIKDQNELKEAVGSIKQYSTYPNKYWVTERVVGGYLYRTDLHLADGFKDVILPVLDLATQKKGAIYFDEPNNVFTYAIIELTQLEIDAIVQQQLDADIAQDLINNRKSDGVLQFDRLMAIIERKFNDGTFSAPLAKGMIVYFDESISSITRGNWIVAKDNLETSPATTNAGALNLYNLVKDKVSDYVTNSY